ncbi:helix-turn-helix domain-containing protein [Microscilla marina]|uniref:Transposase n=1 Tax=Microscilla marina ATCC 23134 TaxID=313606 RepID=A1ZF15_MICM2|nr:helix-turn-helix domain-containing protein [Microscilla marina]EAY31117.1 transposase [Microscilla marina ATCC 23134]
MSQKKYHVDLTSEERSILTRLIQNRKSTSSLVKRAYILLAADRQGSKVWKDQQISEAYGVRRKTVENIRQRFIERGFELTLYGKKQENYREKIFTGDVEAHLIALRCSDPPEGYQRWTYRLLADKMVELDYVAHMSIEGARKILKKRNQALAGKKLAHS